MVFIENCVINQVNASRTLYWRKIEGRSNGKWFKNHFETMPLRILRHKKWHVWNQDNEDRFARDESAFMAKVEEEERNSRMADMEKRIQQMKEMKGMDTSVVHPFDRRPGMMSITRRTSNAR